MLIMNWFLRDLLVRNDKSLKNSERIKVCTVAYNNSKDNNGCAAETKKYFAD